MLLWGARQVGKTTLLDRLELKSKLFLDDLGLRERARQDPALVLEGLDLPCLIDEVQYAPSLFPELKLRIDRGRRAMLDSGEPKRTLYYLTGSNRLLLDENVKESLAGRCHIYALHGLSVRELMAHFGDMRIKSIFLRGGFPELYVTEGLSANRYLNDYILTFIEKDIARTAGVAKIGEFQTVLRLLAARTGQFVNVTEIAGAAGVDNKTVAAWIDLLARNLVIELVPPFMSNLTKRITKMKKLHFYDVGLCARLQGHLEEDPTWNSAQAGALFESLVFSEIAKTRDNFLKPWSLFTWRTKERDEIDFVLQAEQTILIEAKLGIHGAAPFALDREARKVFGEDCPKIVVTVGGERAKLDRGTWRIPIQTLGDYLLGR